MTVVFAGPSLDAAARAALPAEFLPPIRRGDIDLLLARPRPPAVIGVVDGRFLHSLSISPKEILRALDAGVTVLGSSSMGALRAVECEPWGMIGVGRIFQAYRDGAVDADDEVAMVYDEEHRALSEPLVSLRLNLAGGVAAGHVDAGDAQALLDIAKRLYFPERSTRTVLRLAAERIPPARHRELARYLAEQAADIKHDDAVLLLDRIRGLAGQTPPRT